MLALNLGLVYACRFNRTYGLPTAAFIAEDVVD
jgi:hypothetical protein